MGVNPKVVLAPTFPPAVIRTVSNLLSVPFSSVFNVKVSSKRRMLLTGYTVEYSLNITNSVYPSKMYIKLLEDSVTTGTFLTYERVIKEVKSALSGKLTAATA